MPAAGRRRVVGVVNVESAVHAARHRPRRGRASCAALLGRAARPASGVPGESRARQLGPAHRRRSPRRPAAGDLDAAARRAPPRRCASCPASGSALARRPRAARAAPGRRPAARSPTPCCRSTPPPCDACCAACRPGRPATRPGPGRARARDAGRAHRGGRADRHHALPVGDGHLLVGADRGDHGAGRRGRRAARGAGRAAGRLPADGAGGRRPARAGRARPADRPRQPRPLPPHARGAGRAALRAGLPRRRPLQAGQRRAGPRRGRPAAHRGRGRCSTRSPAPASRGLFRLGGDEFAAVLPGAGLGEAVDRAHAAAGGRAGARRRRDREHRRGRAGAPGEPVRRCSPAPTPRSTTPRTPGATGCATGRRRCGAAGRLPAGARCADRA